MASRTRFAVLAGILIVINIAGWIWVRQAIVARGQPRVRVLSALPRRDVEKADRFTLLFDEPVAAANLVGVRLGRSPFVVEPPPAGTWMWSQPDRLDFLLDRQLPPGRVYTVKPAPDLELQLGRRIVGRSVFTFETRALELMGCELGPMDREHATV